MKVRNSMGTHTCIFERMNCDRVAGYRRPIRAGSVDEICLGKKETGATFGYASEESRDRFYSTALRSEYARKACKT